jgi:hypothetical protein
MKLAVGEPGAILARGRLVEKDLDPLEVGRGLPE